VKIWIFENLDQASYRTQPHNGLDERSKSSDRMNDQSQFFVVAKKADVA